MSAHTSQCQGRTRFCKVRGQSGAGHSQPCRLNNIKASRRLWLGGYRTLLKCMATAKSGQVRGDRGCAATAACTGCRSNELSVQASYRQTLMTITARQLQNAARTTRAEEPTPTPRDCGQQSRVYILGW